MGYLLESVEAWCRGQSSSRCLKVWEDGGRKFKLKYRSNKASRFLLRSVRDVEAKKYWLVFLEGKGLVGGRFLLAKKLRALGVSTLVVSKVFSNVLRFIYGGKPLHGLAAMDEETTLFSQLQWASILVRATNWEGSIRVIAGGGQSPLFYGSSVVGSPSMGFSGSAMGQVL